VHEQRVQCSRYWYRAIATNLDQDDWDDHQIMRFDNQQTEASEDHLKASRRDFSAVRAVNHPPSIVCGGRSGGVVWCHARQWTLKLSRHRRVVVEEAIWAIRIGTLI